MADKPTGLTIYRGLSGPNTSAIGATSRREGYAVFGSNSPAVAATYASDGWSESQGLPSEGEVRRFTISPDKVEEFPVRIGRDGYRSFDMFGFDDRARALGPGEVLVVRGVSDTGPGGSWKADPEALSSWGGDTYAIGDGTPVLSESRLSAEDAIKEHRRLVAAGQIKGPKWLQGASEAKQADTFDAATKLRRENVGAGLGAADHLLPGKKVDPYDRMLELFGGEEGFMRGVAPSARSTAARGLSTAMGVAASPIIDYALDPESRTPVQFARSQEEAITSMVPGLVSPSELPPPAVLPPDRVKAVEATQGLVGVAQDFESGVVTEQEVRAYVANKFAKGDKLPAWAEKITSMKNGRLSIKPVNPRTKARQEAAKRPHNPRMGQTKRKHGGY